MQNAGQWPFQYSVRPGQLNPAENHHFRVTAAIIYDTGEIIFTLNGPLFYSAIINLVHYFSSDRENDSIIAETNLVKEGKQFITSHFNIWNADRSGLLAQGYSNPFKNDQTKKAK